MNATERRRFSSIAFWSVAALVIAGVALSLAYVGNPDALLETAYGVMVLTKAVLLVAILALGFANSRLVRRAAARARERRLARFAAMPPRLASPAVGDLLRETNPLAGGPEARLRIEREWSEFNHHWAGLSVLAMGPARWLELRLPDAGPWPGRVWPACLTLVGLLLLVYSEGPV
jgi:hypothetical protein